jgi:hypothetical protein
LFFVRIPEFRFSNTVIMPGVIELHYQVRAYLYQNPQIIPYDHVVEVLLYGGVVPYVVALGVDMTTEFGQATLTWHQALYDVAREICEAGRGHLPYQPFLLPEVAVEEPPLPDREDDDIAAHHPEGEPPNHGADVPLQPEPDIKPPPANAGSEYVEPADDIVPVVDVEAEAVSGVTITVVKTASL